MTTGSQKAYARHRNVSDVRITQFKNAGRMVFVPNPAGLQPLVDFEASDKTIFDSSEPNKIGQCKFQNPPRFQPEPKPPKVKAVELPKPAAKPKPPPFAVEPKSRPAREVVVKMSSQIGKTQRLMAAEPEPDDDPEPPPRPALAQRPAQHIYTQPDTSTFQQARTHEAAFRAKIRELEYHEKKGDLVDRRLTETVIFSTCRLLRDMFLSVPNKLAGGLAAETDPAIIEQAIRAEIRKVLDEAVRLMKAGKVVKVES